MKLSIVIVNYNVSYFLEQCLLSVDKALEGIDAEVFVVDNNSVDNSVTMVASKFPNVHLIANKHNPGFSIANNQAIRISKGEYVLLLNPDTVVQENTFKDSITYMDAHPKVGGLGVRMIDGKGQFLPESKRGLPTPWVSFYKIFGLSKLFPKSKKFGQYQLTFLDEMDTNDVDVLSGAFMFMRKSVLDEVGLLDEAFFMYGEDIDLSYRIQLGGYKNVYFPETSIIHYKGESTKKGSINYVRVFYKAMEIFAKKHFQGQYPAWLLGIIQLAIYFRMSLAIFSRIQKIIRIPILDAIVFYSVAQLLLSTYWNSKNATISEEWFSFIPGIFTLFVLFGFAFLGNNKSPVKIKKVFKDGLLLAFILLLAYNFLPEAFRFSRVGSFSLALSIPLVGVFSRILYSKILGQFDLQNKSVKNAILLAEPEEAKRIQEVLTTTAIKHHIFKTVSPTEMDQTDWNELISVGRIKEIIFSGKSLSSEKIMELMSKVKHTHVDIKIAPSDSIYIIGSNSVNENGELYSMDINALKKSVNLRKKRVFDLIISAGLLIFFPILLWFKNFRACYSILGKVITGKLTWIGFFKEDETIRLLPQIPDGVFGPKYKTKGMSKLWLTQSNRLYARDYSMVQDLEILLGHLFLGRKED